MEKKSNLTPRARRIIENARHEANRLHSEHIGSEHLFLAILRMNQGVAAKVFTQAGMDQESLMDQVSLRSKPKKKLPEGEGEDGADLDYSPTSRKCLRVAEEISKDLGQQYVATEHLLLAILSLPQSIPCSVLKELDVNIEGLKNSLMEAMNVGEVPKMQQIAAGGKAKTEKESGSQVLEKYGINLNNRVKSSDSEPVIGRSLEINRLIHILSRKRKNNPVLVGRAGVGKTAIVEGLAQKIVNGEVPERLRDRVIFNLDLGLLIAGTNYRGQFEQRIKAVMEEVVRAEGRIIVFLDEIHTVIGAGSAEGTMDASNILKPALARGEFPCIGATTLDEYRKYIEKDSALERRFQPVKVEEPDVEETHSILRGLKGVYEKFHGVKYDDGVLLMAAELAERYITDRQSPDKAIDIIDEAGAKSKLSEDVNDETSEERKALLGKIQKINADKKKAAVEDDFEQAAKCRDAGRKCQNRLLKLESEKKTQPKKVTISDIQEIVSNWTGVPVSDLNTSQREKLKKLGKILTRVVIGQDESVKAVAEVLRKYNTPFKDPHKPIGSFLLAGPTGVGKTYLAKIIATEIFGSEKNLIYFDMSEYKDKIDVNKFIGAPSGYVGYEDGGRLVKSIREHPHSVVLFDEIEKAHPDVVQVLLQVLEEGRITDNVGKEGNFRDAIVFATTNASVGNHNPLGFGGRDEKAEEAEKRGKMLTKLKGVFKPEFLNRFDDILCFDHLSEKDCAEIVGLELAKIAARLKKHSFDLSWSREVLNNIAKSGFSDEYGAREVRREITNLVEDKLVSDFLDKKMKKGSKIKLLVKNKKIIHSISS